RHRPVASFPAAGLRPWRGGAFAAGRQFRPHGGRTGGTADRRRHGAHRCAGLSVPAAGTRRFFHAEHVMIRAENLTLIRSGRRLLDEVSVDLKPGKVNVIIGPNGAGKSTLMKVLS